MRLDDISNEDSRLSKPDTAAGRLQRALLNQLRVHERQAMLPTSIRFLFYELIQAGVVSKTASGARRADQNTIDAVTHLREVGLVPWTWIVDETRSLDSWQTAPTVAAYVADRVNQATLDRWDGEPAPLILCESRSLAGTLVGLAATFACPIASTNGQARGFLITEVAPTLTPGQRVLYLGDWDYSGHKIEHNSRRVLQQQICDDLEWKRIALTDEQVAGLGTDVVIMKYDRRRRASFPSVETEALGQAVIVATVRGHLDQLMPEPLADVQEREEQERAMVAEQLRRLIHEE